MKKSVFLVTFAAVFAAGMLLFANAAAAGDKKTDAGLSDLEAIRAMSKTERQEFVKSLSDEDRRALRQMLKDLRESKKDVRGPAWKDLTPEERKALRKARRGSAGNGSKERPAKKGNSYSMIRPN